MEHPHTFIEPHIGDFLDQCYLKLIKKIKKRDFG